MHTAPLYDFGRSERQLARALKGVHRDKIQIFTEVGLRWDADAQGEIFFEHIESNGNRRTVRKDSRPESIRWEVEQSLSRLETEVLDLVQVHQPDVLTPISDTMGALLDLRAEGKLRHIGVSNFSASQTEQAKNALGQVPLSSVQPEYNLVRRDIEHEILPFCLEHKVGVLAYSPLAGGLLASATRTETPANMRRVIPETLIPMAQDYGVTAASTALNWAFNHPGISALITGASSTSQVEELGRARDLRLSETELQRLTIDFGRVSFVLPGQRSVLRRTRRIIGKLIRKVGVDPARIRLSVKRFSS